MEEQNFEKNESTEKVKTTETTETSKKTDKKEQSNVFQKSVILNFLPVILTLASYGFLFLKYLLVSTIDNYDASRTVNAIFFVFAFCCAFAQALYTFLIKKQNKFDALSILNIIALFICFK